MVSFILAIFLLNKKGEFSMNKLKKVLASLMLLFTLSGQLAPSVQVFAEEVSKTEVSGTRATENEEKETKATKESSQTKETTESTTTEEEKDIDKPEIGESQNSNDSPKVEEETDVNEQLAKVLKDYGYYMTTDGKFLSSTNESVRDNWSEFLGKVQDLRSESKIAKRALSIVPYAGVSIFVDQNYSIPTVSWDYSNGIHETGFYAKRDAAGGMLWCVAPGNPLNFGENSGYTTEERDQQNLLIASLIAYWGYETQPSVENAFYTEHHIQNMGTGVSTSNIQDPSGRVSQAGFDAWIKETNRKINSFLTKPSFSDKTYTMKKGETLRIDDTNSSLWAYKISDNTANLQASIDGNTLVLKATGDVKDGGVQVAYNVDPNYRGANLVYRHPYSQELLKARIKDPVYSTINIKIQKEGKLLLKKVDDTGKAIAGAEFNLTANGKTTKATTNSSGELSTPDYNIGTVVDFEETKAPAGHYIDPATSKGSVTLKEGTNTIKVTNPRFANLTLVKKNDKGKNLEGVTFKLNYGNKDYTVKTDKDGQIKVTNTLKNNDKVSYEEVETLKGHYIDPETSKGEITVKSGENTLNINNPTLNFGMTSQAGNTDREQFINPAKDQELIDEVMIEAHQAPTNAKLRLTTDFVEFGTGKELGKESLKQVTEFEASQARFVKAVGLKFDATNMHGKKGVFTNVLEYYNPSTKEWEEVARHDDLNNEDESIQIVEPKIHTEFFWYDQNGKESKLTDPLAKVKGFDRTHYENLISDKEYKFDLALMNKDGKTPFTNPDGKEVTGTLTVIAGKDGVVTSKVDAKEYYENLAKEEAEKEDSKEETQGKEEADVKPLSEEGQEEATDEEEAPEVQTEFSEVKPVELLTGYVDVPFEANLSVANGKEVVAYEQLSTNETPIAEHKDPDSEEQTGKIRNPEISTKAMVNGEKQVTTDGKIKFDDTVEYKDLTPGVEYEMEMTIMVKDENAPLKLQDKEVTGKAKFTPEKENGETTVTVEFDARELFSKYGDSVDLVAFEKTTTNGEVIAVHEDINDSGQTVKINKPVVPAKTTKTTLPQTAGMLTNPYVLIVALALVAGAIFLFKNRKEGQEK